MFDRLDNDNDGYISKDEVQIVKNLLKRKDKSLFQKCPVNFIGD